MNGNPKEGVLEKAESSFESYSGDNVTVIGQTKIYARNKQTQQFRTTRIFVIARERGPILLGNAACQWLGLIAMLIENKAPVVGRFVASVAREETESGEVEAYPILKTGDGAEMTESRPQLQKAIYQTTLYSLREIFNKRQHANARHRVEISHYDNTPKYNERI